MLPDGRGTEVCRELRAWSTAPIIVLSAVEDESEKVAALDAGADDYVDEAVQRRGAAGAPARGAPPLHARARAGDRDRRAASSTSRSALVTVAESAVSLTPTEYELLRLLAENEGGC